MPPLAFVLDFLFVFSIGLAAFWLEDTTGLQLIYSRLTMILGGMMIPVDLFPDNLRPLLASLPFSSIVYGPARMFVKPDGEFLLALLCNQCIAIGGLLIAVSMIWSIAARRLSAHGG